MANGQMGRWHVRRRISWISDGRKDRRADEQVDDLPGSRMSC